MNMFTTECNDMKSSANSYRLFIAGDCVGKVTMVQKGWFGKSEVHYIILKSIS